MMRPIDHAAETVLVTGASSGIGAAFARRLAAKGSNLVLVARRQDRLDALAAEIRQRHNVSASAIVLDLSTEAAGELLLREVTRRGLVVTSVINNAGAGLWSTFADSDPAHLRRTVAVNSAAVMDISRAFLPGMVANGSGYLVNVTSLAAYSSMPMQGVYSATKAFVLSFTEALWAETRGTGIRVLALAPGSTRSEFFDGLTDDPAAQAGREQTPEQVVDAGLRVLERRDPPPSWVSGRTNHAIALLTRSLTRRRAVLAVGAVTMRNA